MKRINNIYDKIISLDNLRLADEKARKNKRKQYGVRLHDKHREADILRLHDMLIERRYKTSAYDEFKINEGHQRNKKERDISRLPYYPDRILHHAIMNVLEKFFVSKFTYNTFSCIKGRGIEGCARYTEKLIKRYEGRKLYCLKMDIKKFYPSINHDVLKCQLKHIIKDKDVLSLLFEIIDSHEGIPIGNYTSQYFANLNLSPLMHKLSEEWHMDAAEYADDIIVLSDDKSKLHTLFREKIKPFIENELKLKVKDNWQIFPVAENKYDKHGRNIDYVGYKFYRKQKLIRKSIKYNYCKCISQLNKNNDISQKGYKRKISAWLGWAKHSNSINLLRTTIKKKFYESIL